MEALAPVKIPVRRGWELPPLILHPFANQSGPVRFPEIDPGSEEIRRHLEARYGEVRMLCYLGKDVNRWLGQCMEIAAGDPGLEGVTEASFVNLLLFDPPAAVIRKLQDWGVAGFQLVFSRALGLNAVYPEPPAAASVSEPLLRHFHLFGDALFDTRLRLGPGREIRHEDFAFEIYSSSEYARLLERAWLLDAAE